MYTQQLTSMVIKKIYLDTNLLKQNKMDYACKIHTTLAMDSLIA